MDTSAAGMARGLAAPGELAGPGGERALRLQSAIEQFSRRIPEMVVIGHVLRRALPADSQRREQP